MQIPTGKTEAEVLLTIKNIARKLYQIFKFGYHTLEDIEQQCVLFAAKALESYDESRPLENFLYIHLRNQLYNFKRNNFERPNKPCHNCPLNAYDPHLNNSISGCTAFENKHDCVPYINWYNRNLPKKSLMAPNGLDSCSEKDLAYKNKENDIDSKLIFELIDQNIPLDMRADYLKVKNGIKIGKKRLEEIVIEIREILINNGYSEESWGVFD